MYIINEFVNALFYSMIVNTFCNKCLQLWHVNMTFVYVCVCVCFCFFNNETEKNATTCISFSPFWRRRKNIFIFSRDFIILFSTFWRRRSLNLVSVKKNCGEIQTAQQFVWTIKFTLLPNFFIFSFLLLLK